MLTTSSKHKESLKCALKRYPSLKSCEKDILNAFEALVKTYKNNAKLLICGNGGSAADAEHISSELMKSFCKNRTVSPEWAEKLGPNLASNLEGALPAIPLTAFTSFNSAFANDRNSEYNFAQLVWALGNKNDTLLAISTSGNSRNVIHAIKLAQAKEMTTIALSGETGGQLADMADVVIRVPEKETFKIQELHLPIYHTLCQMLEEYFFCNDKFRE